MNEQMYEQKMDQTNKWISQIDYLITQVYIIEFLTKFRETKFERQV